MDFELNKIFGAILGTLVFVMGIGFLAEAIYAPIEERGANYALPEPAEGGEAAAAEVEQVAPIAARLQDASADAGESLVARCQSCHDLSEDNANAVGPGLWGVVGREIAHHPDFAYSDALTALAEEVGTWDYEHLDGFLEDPQDYAPGTKMTFAGLSDPQDRADLLAYLRTLTSGEPVALPEPPAPSEEPAEGEGDAPAEGDEGGGQDLAALVAAPDPAAGESVAPRCQSCHDLSDAMETRVGPPIHGIVNDPIARTEDYEYSEALTTMGEEGETWTLQHLNDFVHEPDAFAEGTKMTFPGIADEEDRVNLLAYLSSMEEGGVEAVTGGGAEAAPAEGEEQSAPAEDENAAAASEDEGAAAEDDAASEGDEAAPAEEDAAPAEEDAAQAEEDAAPAGDAAASPEAQSAPADDEAASAEDGADSEGDEAAPAQEGTAPAEEDSASDESDAAPAQDESEAPADDNAAGALSTPQAAAGDEAAAAGDDTAAAQNEQAAQGSTSADADEGTDVAALLADADASAGESTSRQCQACHDLSDSNATRIGPGLYGVVNDPIARNPDYAYSDALASLGEDGESWTPAHLDAFLTDPNGFAQGTKMSFPGLDDQEDRINLIAYLQTLGEDEAAAEGESASAAPAEDETVIELDDPSVAPVTESPASATNAGQPQQVDAEGNQPAN